MDKCNCCEDSGKIVCNLMEEVRLAAQSLDATKTLAVLSDDPDAWFFFDSKPYKKQDLIDKIDAIYGELKSMELVTNTPRVIVLGPDAVLWTATCKGTSVTKSGETVTEELTETWVWQQRNGKWEVVHYHEGI